MSSEEKKKLIEFLAGKYVFLFKLIGYAIFE